MEPRAGAESLRVVAGPIRCADAGFDLVHVHRIGPDLRGFLDFHRAKVLPRSQAR
ncbi:hypothetical protein OH738_07000 [Streptomyces hirsutus]|uniref:hypothetical protein n=1 Tax=Streptomyces hirsutus TaxID=35620 RepID=UPI003866F10F|nr:hypothetical protein OH738_07000 [Streptomyces hirsutus]